MEKNKENKEKNKENKQIKISLKAFIVIVCLIVIATATIIIYNLNTCEEYKGDYQKAHYYDVMRNDNVGNIIIGDYEIVTDYERYKEIISIIKNFEIANGTGTKYSKKFFEKEALLVIDCCGVGSPNYTTELLDVSYTGEVVKVKIYEEYGGVTADAPGDVYFIPVSKNIKTAEIEYESNNTSNPDVCYKPIIYLYPEQETNVEVKLGNPEKLTCSYPKYIDEWKVQVKSNGDLVDLDTNRNLYALYYESKNIVDFKVEEEGFCIKGEDCAKFLEEKLEVLGLNEREAEEFIIYWLPKLESNNYNYIRFATAEEINQNMPLEINPKPDTTIRILMIFKGLDKEISVVEQNLEKKERNGFVAVEWGGTEIK